VSPADLDRWLPDPVVRTHHRREAAATPAQLWEAAGTVTLAETGLLGRLVRWRIPGVAAGSTFWELFRHDPFTVLDEGERYSLSGLCGRIWTRHREFTVLGDPAEFRTWSAPATARVLFAHWVEPAAPGRATLTSEVRVAPVDRRGRLGVRLVSPLVAAFEHLIGTEPLVIAARRAEGG
jgi:hypothetical protein